MVSSVKPGYLRDALPRKSTVSIPTNEDILIVRSIACAPENGEQFQTIADDYQSLIIPGMFRRYRFSPSRKHYHASYSFRNNPLVSSRILRLFPNVLHVRRNTRRFVCKQHTEPWFQREQLSHRFRPLALLAGLTRFYLDGVVDMQSGINRAGSRGHGLGRQDARSRREVPEHVFSRWRCHTGNEIGCPMSFRSPKDRWYPLDNGIRLYSRSCRRCSFLVSTTPS